MSFTLENHLTQYEGDLDFLYEQWILRINDQICEIMKSQGITKEILAEKMGVKKGYITRILNGLPNMNLRLLTKIYFALGVCPVEVVFGDNE